MTTKTQKIPKGYKQTEVGVIPEDWEVKKVRDFGEVITGSTPSTKVKDYWDGNIPWITPTDITDKKDIYISEREITHKALSISRKLPNNSLLITCIASIGKNVVLRREGACNQQINAIVPSKEYDVDFLYYLFENRKQYLLGHAGITATNIISKNNFVLINFAVPKKLFEQSAIAQVLSDIDALIESLDRLIAKKKAIKKGTMQQLLTGKRRLPGFTGKWERKRLGEILDYERPDKYIVKNTEYSDNGLVPVLTANKSFILGYTNEDFRIYRKHPAIIFDDFTTESKYVDFPFKVKSSAIKILKCRDDNSNLKFIYEKMQLIKFPLGDHKRYYISEYQNIEINIPSKLEQSAIAQILSDMDAEIETLEKKRDKCKMIKQGAMQVLLTGKVRLV